MGKEEAVTEHPYEFLTRMNQLFSGYVRSSARDYSSVSQVRLPFKPFKVMRVPQCFKADYVKSLQSLPQTQEQRREAIDENQKKLWKQHGDILARYKRQSKTQPQPTIQKPLYLSHSLLHSRSHSFIRKIAKKRQLQSQDPMILQKEIIRKMKKRSRECGRAQTAGVALRKRVQMRCNSQYEEQRNKSQTIVTESDEIVLRRLQQIVQPQQCGVSAELKKKTQAVLQRIHTLQLETDAMYN